MYRNIGSIWTRDDLEAIVKQRLRFVVCDAHQLHTFFGVTRSGARPNDTHRDVVVVTWFQGKGSCSLNETTVSRGVTGRYFCPGLHIGSTRTPVEGVRITREHVVCLNVQIGTCGSAYSITSISHLLTILPYAIHVVVEVQGSGRFAIDLVATVVVIHKTTHPKTLIVDHTISISDANAFVRNSEGVHGIAEIRG